VGFTLVLVRQLFNSKLSPQLWMFIRNRFVMTGELPLGCDWSWFQRFAKKDRITLPLQHVIFP
jgi:hypothetical protein